jgi:hypothetical protein
LNFAQIRGVTLPPFWSKWDDKPRLHRKSLTHYRTNLGRGVKCNLRVPYTAQISCSSLGSGLCVSTIQTWQAIGTRKSSLIGRGLAGVSPVHTSRFEPRTFFWRSQGPRMGYTSEPSPLGWVVYCVIWCNQLVATASVEHNRASNGCCCTHFFCCIVCQWWCSVQFRLISGGPHCCSNN